MTKLYSVTYVTRSGGRITRTGLTYDQAERLARFVVRDGARSAGIDAEDTHVNMIAGAL